MTMLWCWSPIPIRSSVETAWKRICGKSLCTPTKKFLERQQKKRARQIEARRKGQKNSRWKKNHFPETPDNNQGARGDRFYGDSAQQPDLGAEIYQDAEKRFLDSLNLTSCEIKKVEEDTRNQCESDRWKEERRKRLTASRFGEICKIRDTTSFAPTRSAASHIPQAVCSTEAIEYGKASERLAEEFKKQTGLSVRPSGLVVSSDFPYLAASPDGIASDGNVLKLKYPFTARSMTPKEAASKFGSGFFCSLTTDTLTLRKTHNYYYQVQGQLHLTGANLCYFIVWTPCRMSIEKINFDTRFWEERMLPKLQRFYLNCLLPELVDSRMSRNMQIREPEYILEAQHAETKEK